MGKVIITFVGGSKLLHLWVKCIITFVGEIITFVGKVLLHLWALLHLWGFITFVCVTGVLFLLNLPRQNQRF